jgi:phosphoribosylformimino-5-aminoimidazole carboxamide ribotide isomerase
MLLIPSIDLRGGRCVRLRQGDFATERSYSIEPAALLHRYHALGARWLHVVDLDGAKDGVTVNAPLIESLARHPMTCLQVGGGIRSGAAVDRLLSAGVARVVIGSAAVQRPQEVTSWLRCFGSERLCVAFDVHIGPLSEPQVHTHGWTQNSALSLWNAIRTFPAGALRHVLCTDIGRDGTLRGPNLALYRSAATQFPHLLWQASGGIRNARDLRALAGLGLTAAVTGTALLESRIPPKDLRPFLPAASFPASTSATAR